MAQKLLSQKQIEKTLVLQHDQSDCGVACLLSLIKYYNGNNTLEKLRELSGTTKQGTTLLGLFQAANKLGFDAQGNEADIQSLINHGNPTILHVVIEKKLQHYIICYGYKNNKFIIGDPAKGISHYTVEDIQKIWQSKTCITLKPNSYFVEKEILKSVKREWFLKLLREDYKLLSFSLILGVFIAVLGMAMAVFSQKLIDNILPTKDYNKLITGIFLVGFLLLIRVFLSVTRSYFIIRQTKDFNNRIINSFYSALLNLPKSFFDTRKIGELVARLNDTQRVQRVINVLVNSLVIDALVILISIGFIFYYSWQTGIIALVTLPLYFVLIYSFNKKIITTQKQVMQGYAFSESNFISTIKGIEVIKNNNRQFIFNKLNQFIYSNYQEQIFLLGKINIRLSLLSGIFSVIFLISILTYTALKVYNDAMQLGELIAVLSVAGSLLPSVVNLALITIPINEAKVAFDRMYEFAAIEKEQEGKITVSDFKSLKINNLSFRFAGRKQLLKEINLTINKGEFIGIVGESGSGKSTLGQILQKFYEKEHGTIIINNNHNIEDVELTKWRNIIGVIPQEITIFNGNVIDNILLGKEDNPEHVIEFCKDYGFEKFIADLPQGYGTILGEEGINLSGGQRQVLALARILYKRPQLLILDEYASAMDRKTERFSIDLLQSLKNQIGVIFISHRLHSLSKIVDRIYVLENGMTEYFGSHEKLMRTSNFYSDFWKELGT